MTAVGLPVWLVDRSRGGRAPNGSILGVGGPAQWLPV